MDLFKRTYYWGMLLPLLLPVMVQAQRSCTINGYVSDAETGERLSGATLRVSGDSQGAITNDYGFYSLSLDKGPVTLYFSYVGYQSDTLQLELQKDRMVNVPLRKSNLLSAISVKGNLPIEKRNDISTITLNMRQVNKLPSFLGEKDLLKAVQLLPGVQAGLEGSSGIYVRGGGPDENLILLDGVPVYNVSHLFGFFSVFTPEAIKDVKLIKGGFPARYGGRLSSVLDIKMKEGDLKQFKGDASIGLLSSKVTVQGPIKKDTSSFIVSARRSYWDLLASPIMRASSSSDGSTHTLGYYFQDFNAKFNYAVNNKNKLYLSLYTGKDQFHTTYIERQNDEYGSSKDRTRAALQWGNITAALRWNTQISPRLFANTTLSYSQFNYELEDQLRQTEKHETDKSVKQYLYRYHSDIKDWSLHWDADYYPARNHAVKFGLHATRHRFMPGVSLVRQTENGAGSPAERQGSALVSAGEYQLYAEDNISLGDRLQINMGFHGSAYHVRDTTFLSLQPRIRGRFAFPGHWSLKFGFATMWQPLHLLVSGGVGLPTDLWVPATKTVVPEQSIQYTLGFAKTLPWNMDLSVEAYYKRLRNVIAYKDGANFTNTASDWESKVEAGKGEAYGLEAFLQKKTGFLTGWLGYTLAWNKRQFDGLNNGERFPYKFDRRHNIKLVLSYALTDRIDLSATWVYSTGNTITLPVGDYSMAENAPLNYTFPLAMFDVDNSGSVAYIPSRNNFRMRAFHRLTVGIDFKKEKKHGTRVWNISIYNVYSRQNPFFYYYERQTDDSRKLMQFSLLPIMPSVSYSFKF